MTSPRENGASGDGRIKRENRPPSRSGSSSNSSTPVSKPSKDHLVSVSVLMLAPLTRVSAERQATDSCVQVNHPHELRVSDAFQCEQDAEADFLDRTTIPISARTPGSRSPGALGGAGLLTGAPAQQHGSSTWVPAWHGESGRRMRCLTLLPRLASTLMAGLGLPTSSQQASLPTRTS